MHVLYLTYKRINVFGFLNASLNFVFVRSRCVHISWARVVAGSERKREAGTKDEKGSRTG